MCGLRQSIFVMRAGQRHPVVEVEQGRHVVVRRCGAAQQQREGAEESGGPQAHGKFSLFVQYGLSLRSSRRGDATAH